MANRLYQSIIHQMKDAIGREIGVLDESGTVIACSDLSKIGEVRGGIREELSYVTSVVAFEGYTYRFVPSQNKSENIVFTEGEDKYAEKMVSILSVSLGSLKNMYDDKYDKASFIKNIMLDNILPNDVYVKSKELHFSTEEERVVYLVRFYGNTDLLPQEILQGMFPDKTRDYVLNVAENDIVLVKELPHNYTNDDIMQMARSIVETLNSEFFVRVAVGVSTVVDTLKDLAGAYKEAKMALEVGRVFDTEKSIISYENLGIGRLVYQLPTTLCEIFLQEVFKNGSFESLDQETLQTVQCFFENNLNVSETSRKLFVHRNTLVYRLEKIKKLVGLDLREFDHAITFKVALMVKKYLASKPSKF